MSAQEKGWSATRLYLRDDMSAALGSALITIPLALGIALAAGVPPMAGLFSAIVGGVVATFIRGSHLALNGTSAGLVVVTLLGIQTLGHGDPVVGFKVYLAATIIAGGLLMLAGLLRLGRFGDMIPPSVSTGTLIAIGIVIISKQFHEALGVNIETESAFEGLRLIPYSLRQLNPFVAIIALISVVVLVLHPKLSAYRLVQALPAPIWLLLFAVPFVFWFNFFEPHSLSFLGKSYEVGPHQLLALPQDTTQAIVQLTIEAEYVDFHAPMLVPVDKTESWWLPDFSQIHRFFFWAVVLEIAFIIYVESLISAKVVDKIDPFGRHSNTNRDLFAVGMSNAVVGWLGGLPIITAIPMYTGAKTRMFNFYHGFIILIFAFILTPVLHYIPLAALAALLVFTGYKLASFKMFRDLFRRGDDQFIIAVAALVLILFNGILLGILGAICVTLIMHYAKSNLTLRQFAEHVLRPRFKIKTAENQNEVHLRVKGILNFMNLLQLKKQLVKAVVPGQHLVLDLSGTRLIDYTVMEYLHERAERYDLNGCKLDIIGLDTHDTASRHPYAMHILPEDKRPALSKRQQDIAAISQRYEGQFWPEIRWDASQFKNFRFFQTRPVEYKLNTAKGTYWMFFEWETCDITFEEGTLFANQERHATVALLYPPFNPPVFVLEREDAIDKVRAGGINEDINFKSFPHFSEKFALYGTDANAIIDFFNAELLEYLDKNDDYHIECDGATVLVFNQMRFASPADLERFHAFCEGLAKILLGIFRNQALSIS